MNSTSHTRLSTSVARKVSAWLHTRLGRPLASALLAQSCALCHLPSGNAPVCASCARDLPLLPPDSCHRCALPVNTALTACPDCMRHPPHFDSAHAAWIYDFPVDALIRDFKYGHHLYLGQFFAEHLTEILEQHWAPSGRARPDLIIPMPLHPNRLRTRGFNQAAEIARHMAKQLNIPCAYNLLIRRYDTPSQAGLHRDQRWRNLLGAFACTQTLAASHILLVDDVLTTGASLSACADILRASGARRIDVAVVARTPEPGSRDLS